jgi:hypothetical protein
MVVGLDIFTKHFEHYADHYILIGGSACDVQMEDRDLKFRVTTDLDIILIVEALTGEFVRHFWEFIRAGGYEVAEVNEQKRFYRFRKPKNEAYPRMLELFARHPDALPPADGLHITDIPTGEDMSSLSAILLDEDYYNFARENSELKDGLHLANSIALIGLKAKAYLNNFERKGQGQPVQAKDITKHRNDVIRLATVIPGQEAGAVTGKVRTDITQFIELALHEDNIVKAILKDAGIPLVAREDIIHQLRLVFGIGS